MFRYKGFSIKLLNKCRLYSLFGCGTPAPVLASTKITCLSNGMRVATEESNSPIACVALFVDVGPIYEKPTNYGITHFVEHMAYRGFKSMSKQQLDDCLTNIGAKFSVVTTREFQVFSAQCFVENVPDIVSILSKIGVELELSDLEIEAAKCIVDLETIDVEKNTKAVVSDFLHESAFQGTPLSHRVIGPSWNLKKFDKHVIDSYLKENYYPSRFVLATSGAVSHESMVCFAQTSFCQTEQICVFPQCLPQRFTGSQIAYRDDSMPLTHVALAVEAPGSTNSDYITMLVASNIIGSWSKSQGGHNRHGSPLARAAATSNLCDSFESFYIKYRDVGLWGIYIIAEKMDIEDMIANVQDRWMHLCTTTIYNDVQRAINATKLELAKKIEGPVKSCYDIGMQLIYSCERTNLPQMYEALSKVNEKEIKKVVTQYIYDRCPVVVAVGPIETVPEYTRIRAGMYWLRL